MLFDHYLCVSQWSPEFASLNANIQRTLVSVRFSGLNLLYYNENVLMGMELVIGRPIRVDQNTLKVQRGRFARVCIEIDLSQLVVGKIWLQDHWYRVEYEGLHLICAKYRCYGHLAKDYSANPIAPLSNSIPAVQSDAPPPPIPPGTSNTKPVSSTTSATVFSPHVS